MRRGIKTDDIMNEAGVFVDLSFLFIWNFERASWVKRRMLFYKALSAIFLLINCGNKCCKLYCSCKVFYEIIATYEISNWHRFWKILITKFYASCVVKLINSVEKQRWMWLVSVTASYWAKWIFIFHPSEKSECV